MKEQDTLLQEDFNPSFLFTWKGIRREDEKSYHRHEHLEFCYVMSGQGRHRIEDRIYEVREGDLILINAGEYHQALIRGEGEPAVEFYVGLTDIYLKGHEKNCLPQPEEEPILHTSGELKMKLGRLCISMESEKERERFGGYFMMKTYALQMLLLFLREQEQPGTERPVERYPFESVNRKYMVEKIMDYFEEHYMQKISLGQIAGNMYLSPFYISKIFKAETGETPIHFLIEIRMEKARELLLADPALRAFRKWLPGSGMMMPIISASCLRRNSGRRLQRCERKTGSCGRLSLCIHICSFFILSLPSVNKGTHGVYSFAH